jgi:hypothetical protein
MRSFLYQLDEVLHEQESASLVGVKAKPEGICL